jgi:lincosamide nucleotidyltransferase A/C/D/E
MTAQLRRAALAAYVGVARSRWTRLCDVRVVSRLTTVLWETRLVDVLAVLDAFEDAGVTAWLAGGWGVDALLGDQSRRHTDLDVLIVEDRPNALEDATDALHRLGYGRLMDRPPDGDMPAHFALFDAAGHFVDLMPLDLEQSRFAALAGPDSPLVVTGKLGERAVQCLDTSLQLALHKGVPRLARRSRLDAPKLERCLTESDEEHGGGR